MVHLSPYFARKAPVLGAVLAMMLPVEHGYTDDATIADFLAKPSLNVVITVSDMEKAKEFYGGVLGLEAMAPIPFSDKTADVFFPRAITMDRFRVGTHEIKLIPGLETTEKRQGGVANAIGLRMVNYPILDIEAFKARLREHGYPEPTINAMPGSSYRFGMLKDPDGNQVEFYFYDGEGPAGWRDSIQIALTVSDIEASRKFYGETLGMDELPPVDMPGGDRKVYLFRNGPTLIKFWSYGGQLPNHAGRHLDAYGYRYIQYATQDIRATYDFVRERGATIDLPPTAVVEDMPVEIIFVADPDGIINEMFGVVQSD